MCWSYSSTFAQHQKQQNHRQSEGTASLLAILYFLTPNIAIFCANQLRRYSICLSPKWQDLKLKTQLDPLYSPPWSCRLRSHETNLSNSTPRLRWLATPASLLITQKFPAPARTSSTIPDSPFGPYRNSRATRSVQTSTLQ